MNLFMSYNHAGFETAKAETEPCPEGHIQFLIDWGSHDLSKGFCSSFQIYNELGKVVFSKEFQEAA